MNARGGSDLASFLLAMPEERRAALRALVNSDRHQSHQQPISHENNTKTEAAAETETETEREKGKRKETEAEAIFRAVVTGPEPRTALQGDVGKKTRENAAHFVLLSTVRPAALHWRSPGRIAAGKITILDGDPGLGKSTLLCELAARVTRGDPLPGGEREEPRGVILLSAEDDLHDTIRPRLDAAGGDPKRVVSLVSVPDLGGQSRSFTVPGDGWLLEEMVQRLDAALIIIDPLVAYLHGGVSANSDQDVRRALAELKQVGERTGAAIVAVRHLNKSVGANPLYRGGGSIGIIGAARCGLLLAPDPDDPDRRILAATKGNLGKLPSSLAFRLVEDGESGVARVVWDGETRWTAAQLLRAGEDGGEEDRSVLGEVRAWLRMVMGDGQRLAKDVEQEAKERGFSAAAIVRAKKAEGVISRKVGDRWVWQLREDVAPTQETHVSQSDQPFSQPPLGILKS